MAQAEHIKLADHQHAHRILLIEDDAGNIAFLKLFLETMGYSYRIAEQGSEAIESLASQTFDLILMDLNLPDMDGYHLCQYVQRKGVVTPVIGLSAETNFDKKKKCLASGMKDLVDKASVMDVLPSMIEDYCH